MPLAMVLNVGSSSFKWALVDEAERNVEGADEPALSGVRATDEARMRALAARIAQRGTIVGVGHRVVHGGATLVDSVLIDQKVRDTLEAILPLDPLHAKPALEAIDLARAVFETPHVAVFDTQFHATIPPDARAYALPTELADRLGIRKFGFHGINVAYTVRRAAEMLGTMPRRLVVAHLGSGSSITAVRDGASVDTTMGPTPLDGMTMRTRTGSIDPGVVLHLLRSGLGVDEVAHVLEKESGLRGMSGTSGDLREVRRAREGGDARAKLAYTQLVRSWCRTCGAMIGSLGGIDALVFTAGIGEHDTEFRTDAARALGFLGIELDESRNRSSAPDRLISGDSSRVAVLVIAAREDLEIAREVRRVLCRAG